MGARIEALLAEAGVDYRAVPIAGQTRESLTVDESSTGRQYRFVLPGPEISAAEQERILDCFRDQPADYLVVSGSLPPGVGSDFYARLGELHRGGGRLVLDSSGAGLRTAARAQPWLIKPSLRELEELVGRALPDRAAIQAAARDLVNEGLADVVVVSQGEEGATWVSADAADHIDAIPVEAVSAVGAGDAMVAGITLASARGMRLGDAIRYGVAAGAATLLGPGTTQVRPEDVDRLYRQIPPGV
jgi:6-phosphofructokinase 2